nr:hypothetical protein [Tanacetum cinerariifolium]
MDLCTRLQKKQIKKASKINAQDLEISNLKARIQFLEDKNRGGAEPSGEDATINGRSLEIGEEAGVEKRTERGSNDTEELVNVLTSLDAANILTSGVHVVSVPPTAEVSTVGKEKMVESDTPKKKKLQEQIDVQVSGEMKEQMAREDQRMNEQIARDAEIVRIHAEEELRMLIDGLDTNNEIIAKYLQEEDLNQLWALVKETLSIRHATSDKEKELWVELKRLFEPDFKDQLWTHTQALMHDPVEWKLYDSCSVHHVLTRDQEIFMLVEKDYPLRKD